MIMTIQNDFIARRYAPLSMIASMFGLSAATLKYKLHIATQKGIPLPPRRRVAKLYMYDVPAFEAWLWEHAETLKRKFDMNANETAND